MKPLDTKPIPTHCRFCLKKIELVENKKIYGKNYGDYPWAYYCEPCEAYVGLHPGTLYPLGTLANAGMRKARKVSKNMFIHLYRSRKWNRNKAYPWLAKQLDIPTKTCHFGWFEVNDCKKVMAIIKKEKDYAPI